MGKLGQFSYGFDEELENGAGGAMGSQVGSQTGGSGAGLPSFNSLQTTPGSALQSPKNTGITGGMGLPNSQVPAGLDKLPGSYNTGFAGGIGLPNADAPPPGTWGPMVPMDPVGRLPMRNGQPPANAQALSRGPAQPSALPQSSVPVVQELQSTLAQLQTAGTPQDKAVLSDQLSRSVTQALQAQGHKVTIGEDGTLVVDGRPYSLGGSSSALATAKTTMNAAGGGAPVDPTTWQPSGQSGYTPGEIPIDDVPVFTYEQLMKDMGGSVDESTAKLLEQILANPESMDPRMVDTLKAASKDELADLFAGDMDRLRELGVDYGIDDSPWLAAEEMDARGQRNRSLVGSNRAIDIDAAKTNFNDRLRAAEAGTNYGTARASRVSAAASTALASSAAKGDRLALREQVAAEAARLNLSAEQVMADFVSERLADATRRYGIDIGAQISREQLAQADKHFLEELSFKIEALAQQDRHFREDLSFREDTFGAEHDLNLRQQGFLEDQAAWQRANSLLG